MVRFLGESGGTPRPLLYATDPFSHLRERRRGLLMILFKSEDAWNFLAESTVVPEVHDDFRFYAEGEKVRFPDMQ